MRFEKHLQDSLERAKQEYPLLYSRDRKKVEIILTKVHKMLDANFAINSQDIIRHRETTHHQEGIEEIAKVLSKDFGNKYTEMILKEAARHVVADMGQLYTKADYQRPYFWDKWKVINEDITAWI